MKKLLWLIPALALILSLSAFKTKSTTSFTGEAWFEYIGDVNGGGYSNPLNFQYSPSGSCSSGTAALCRIFVVSDGQPTPHPDEDALDDMQSEISSAIGNGDTGDVKLKGS